MAVGGSVEDGGGRRRMGPFVGVGGRKAGPRGAVTGVEWGAGPEKKKKEKRGKKKKRIFLGLKLPLVIFNWLNFFKLENSTKNPVNIL